MQLKAPGSTMRRLLLFRHANAERAESGKSDLDRVLTAEGKHDATLMGAYIGRHGFHLDRVVVSPATRTRETWAAVAAALRLAPAAVFDEHVYDASAQTLLNALKQTPDAAHTVMLIGHNPGLHDLALTLVATGDIDTRERLGEKFPTSGLAILDFPLDAWARLHARAARLERFVSPKTITRATN
jgi:phosphohistidine phosphatase